MKILNRQFRSVGLSQFLIVLAITGATARLLPAKVDNAALFYYQALIECPDGRTPEYFEKLMYLYRRDNVANDNTEFRQVMDTYHRVVTPFVQVGIQAEYCDWGVLPQTYHRSYLQSTPFSDSIYERADFLCAVLVADAGLSMFDGDTRGALQKSLSLYKLCCHLGQHPRIALCGIRGALAFTRMVRDILGNPIEQETLAWLRDQVKAELDEKSRQDRSIWVIHALKEQVRGELDKLQKDVTDKAGPELDPNGSFVTDAGKEIVLDEVLAWLQVQIEMNMNRVYPILKDMKAPYEATYSRFSNLVKTLEFHPPHKGEINDSNAPKTFKMIEAIDLGLSREFLVFETRMSALLVAIEIYLIQSKTGHLPESIPTSAPKTPYNNEPFEYKITDDGFTLRYRRKWEDIANLPPYYSEFEFKVSSSPTSMKTNLSTKEKAIASTSKH